MGERLNAEKIWAAVQAKKIALAEAMPNDQVALDSMFDAYIRLKDLGWREAIYCPKDGTLFDVMEAGSTGIHTCHYEGEWPTGSWWVHHDDDLWPSRPILFREKQNDRTD